MVKVASFGQFGEYQVPVQVVYGDEFLVSAALRELQEEVGPIDIREANSHHIAAAQANLSVITPVCDAIPFLAEKRLVIVEGALGAVEQQGRGARGRRGSTRSTDDGWDGLEAYLERMPPTTLLVFVDGPLHGRNSLLERLRPSAQTQNLATPSGEALARWIRGAVGAKGATVVPGAISLLSRLVGPNLRVLDNELEKLALYAGNDAISEAHVRALVPEAREASIFNLVDAVLERRPAVALRASSRLRQNGADFSYIIAMMARQLRLVVLARDLLDGGFPTSEMGNRLNIGAEFVVRKTIQQARSYSSEGLVQLYEALLDADLAVKQGRLEEELALQLFFTQAAGR